MIGRLLATLAIVAAGIIFGTVTVAIIKSGLAHDHAGGSYGLYDDRNWYEVAFGCGLGLLCLAALLSALSLVWGSDKREDAQHE